MASPSDISTSIADYLGSFGGVVSRRTRPGRSISSGAPQPSSTPLPLWAPRAPNPEFPAIPSETESWEEFETAQGGVESSAERHDRPEFRRRYNPMGNPPRPLVPVSSEGGTFQLTSSAPSYRGWVRNARWSTRRWGLFFRRFIFSPDDPRSAPVVGVRYRVPSRGQRPAPRWPVAIRYGRAVSRTRVIPGATDALAQDPASVKGWTPKTWGGR